MGNAGLVYQGLKILGEGAVLAGMVLGSIVAFILMRKFYASAIAAGVGAVLSWIGLIHASEVGLGRRSTGGARLRNAGNRAGGVRLPPAQ